MNLKRIIAIIITILLIASFILTGCSQRKIHEDSSSLDSNENIDINKKNDTPSIDDELIKEVEASHTFEEPFIALDPYENAPLSALIIFTTDEETGVKIKIVGQEKAYDVENQFEKAKEHIIPIYGLYAGEENTVIVTLDDGRSKELKITTDIIEEPYNRANVIKLEDEKMKEGLTFVSFGMKSPNEIVAAAYDGAGEIRWALKSDAAAWDIYKLNNGRLLVSSSEKHSDPYYTAGVREIDLMGKTYAKYIFPGGYHHSAVELPNGNLLVAAQDENSDTREDVVFEISRETGAIIKTFDIKNILPMDDGASLNTHDDDWFHNNSVWYEDKSKSIILSGRNADAVISIDYESGKLKWILGDPEGWTKLDKNYFLKPLGKDLQWPYAQHAAMVTPKGHIFVFDNGVFRAKKTNEENKLSGDESYSRAVIYKINEDNMTIKQLWQYGKELGPNWYSFYLGDVDYLSENHYIVNSGGQLYDTVEKTHEVGLDKLMNPETQKTASIVEIKNDEVIFEIEMNYNIFAAERMNLYTKDSKFNLYDEVKVLKHSN